MEKWVSRIVDGRRESGAVAMTPEEEVEFTAYRASLPPPRPVRDLAGEIDALRARVEDLETSGALTR